MNLLIPVDDNHKITPMGDKAGWMLIFLKNGNKTDEKFYHFKDEIKEIIDFVVLKDKNDDIDDFLDEDIGILIAPFQEEVDDIVEAFIFRELYELGN